ncbi:hypothetical protein QCM80_08055 [Bradyrhizobium sp. SSUT112]|nr:hypothetical protein [Bradyrhizobium sp. SSUT112]MDH2350619.1 hypothetical protein [Bradyrhizobium sp. SSUT112]
MRHTDEAINEQLKEARIQNENVRAQMRANITSEGVSHAPVNENGSLIGWEISPAWKNNGTTDAKKFRSRWSIEFVPYTGRTFGPDHCPKITIDPSSKATDIGPSHAITELSKRLTKENVLQNLNREGAIYLVEVMEYRDIFPNTEVHRLSYCAVILPNDFTNNVFSFVTMQLESD